MEFVVVNDARAMNIILMFLTLVKYVFAIVFTSLLTQAMEDYGPPHCVCQPPRAALPDFRLGKRAGFQIFSAARFIAFAKLLELRFHLARVYVPGYRSNLPPASLCLSTFSSCTCDFATVYVLGSTSFLPPASLCLPTSSSCA